MKKIIPRNDYVCILTETPDEKQGEIYIPQATQKPKTSGEVIAVGPGELLQDGTRAPMDLKVGDKVLFSGFGDIPVKIGETTYQMIPSRKIIATLE